MTRRTTVPDCTAALVASLLLVAGCEDEPQTGGGRASQPVSVIAQPLSFEPARTRVEAVGTSRALRSVQLHPAASGEVVAVNFVPGQKVRAGDVLVELDSRDERLAVELAQVRLEDAERLYDRYRRSGSSGAVLPTQLDAARTQAESARIELGRARVALDDRFVKAPFDGHVDVTDIDPGDRISVDTLITTIDDRSALLVSFEAPELLVGDLSEGDEVSLVAWNRGSDRLTGEIVELGSRIDPATRTFVARATVDNSNDRLRPGMSFRVSVAVQGETYPVLAETAVQWGAEGAFVWTIADGTARRVPVTIIQRQKGRVLVDGDMSPGDLIVVEGIQRMRNDVPVDYQMIGVAGSALDDVVVPGGRSEHET
jgi:membrane fusion protein (multidrug efflux system)